MAWLDHASYGIERSLVWVALLVMAGVYWLAIVDRELTAGAGRSAVEQAILKARGLTVTNAPKEALHAVHTIWAPLILFGGTFLLLVVAAWTAPLGVGLRRRAIYFAKGLLGAALFGLAIVYLPSKAVVVLVLAGATAAGLWRWRAGGGGVKRIVLPLLLVLGMVVFALRKLPTEFDWAVQLSRVLLMWVGFLGAAMATYENRNIQVDFVRKNVPRHWLLRYEIVAAAVTALFTVVLAVLAVRPARIDLGQSKVLEAIPIPSWLIPLPIAIGFVLIAVRYGLLAWRLGSGTETVQGLDGAPASSKRFLRINLIFAILSVGAFIALGKGAWLVVALLVLLLAGAPLYVLIGGLAVACFALWPTTAYTESLDLFHRNFTNIVERMRALEEQEALIAIPFFMIAGAIMTRGAIARKLVDCADAAFGWLPGGLAVSAVAACVFVAAISGASPVTVITIGAIMYPALVERGYKDRFATGLVTSAGSLGIIIPPSIPMIIFALIASMSSTGTSLKIKDLFIAGIGPGLVIAFALGTYCVFTGAQLGRTGFRLSRLLTALRDGFWALFLPFFILAGIYLGFFNAIEASAIAVILSLLIELFVHQELRLEDLPEVLADSASLMGSILTIICVALGLNEFLASQQVAEKLVDWLASFEVGPLGFMLMLNVMLILVGCVMDIISAIILFVPLILPLANALGFDPIHLGLVFIVNLEIGYLTPPLGLNLFVASGCFNKPFGEVMRAVVPFIGILLVCLAAITAIPSISVGPVNLMYGRPFYSAFPSGKHLVAKKRTMDASTEKFIDDVSEGEPEDLEALDNTSRASEVQVKGKLEAYDPTAVRAVALRDAAGKHVRTLIVFTMDEDNCGEAGGEPDASDKVLRIEVPAGLKAGQKLSLKSGKLKMAVVTYEDGKITGTKVPTKGFLKVMESELPDAIVALDPASEVPGMSKGLFGAFLMGFGDSDAYFGRFAPSPCDAGSAPVYR